MLIAPEDPGSETIRVPVLKVFDGDGFLTRIDNPRRGASLEVTIRLGFIDAPEMEQPGGIEARDFLQSLIGGRHVDLGRVDKRDSQTPHVLIQDCFLRSSHGSRGFVGCGMGTDRAATSA
ncbi:hypothetical protein MACH24_05160 [Erythrobacter sp. Dej080120_24]|nr:hypothetical protein MACH24_05160 [Erythrobacter sp. Dej080120_24]